MLIKGSIRNEYRDKDLILLSKHIQSELENKYNFKKLLESVKQIKLSGSELEMHHISEYKDLCELALDYAQKESQKNANSFSRYVDAFSEVFISLIEKSTLVNKVDCFILMLNGKECILNINVF